ncbi:MAG TPA: TusE/DsrC/DsvC family sulfur relay protein [Wenzhouxiangella sp.]|nr:TusE/DsrC/DsvC family sulfur relay protein [Wenzhouxiangella sp.]
MPETITAQGHRATLDEDGFLTDAAQWAPALASALAARDGVELGEDHWWLIEFVRDYYHRYGNPPLMRVVVAEFRKYRPQARGSRELYRLFPDGPVRLACKYGGLPKPDWCI